MLNREKLQSMFHMCLPEAAKRLEVSQTTFKHTCLGVSRWPLPLKYPAPSNARGGATTKVGTNTDSSLTVSCSEESNLDDDKRDSTETHTASQCRHLRHERTRLRTSNLITTLSPTCLTIDLNQNLLRISFHFRHFLLGTYY